MIFFDIFFFKLGFHERISSENSHKCELNKILCVCTKIKKKIEIKEKSFDFMSYFQGRSGHSGNAKLVAGAFTISHTKCLNFGGFLDFFVWNVTGAF
jgi:hypothetical protein